MAPPLLEVDDLHTEIRRRSRVVRAVTAVSLRVDEGETVGLVGESGCGKTLTALSIIRLLPPGGVVVRGAIRLKGRDLAPLTESQMRSVRGGQIGMVFQDPMTSLNPTMPIGLQVAEPLRAHHAVSRRNALRRAHEVLGLVGLPHPSERMNDFPHQLSGGLRQRVMIAIALACEPSLLIADEPTTALDVTIQAQILELLDRLKSQLSMGLLLITHDLGVIAGRADRIVVMYAGRVVEAADTNTVFYSNRHRYTEALLASVPTLEHDRAVRLHSIPGSPPDLSEPEIGCPFAPRCQYATSRCREENPPLEGARQHIFACFHPRSDDHPGAASAQSAIGVHSSSMTLADQGVSNGKQADLISLVGVSKTFKLGSTLFGFGRRTVSAVSDVSLTVRRGETLGLVGESGSGKTTIGRLVVGLEQPDSGTITFAGANVATMNMRSRKRARRRFQMMFQDPYASLDPRMRIFQILSEPFLIQNVGSGSQQQTWISDLLRTVGLPRRATALYPHEFSGGQRQRIGLARAVALGPELVIADEPVSALDVSIRSQILNLMRAHQRDRGVAFIVISHDLSVVKYLADRIGVLYLGQLMEIGEATEIYSRPAHPYTGGLLAAIPVADPERARAIRSAPVRGELPSPINPPSGCRFRTRCPRAQTICAESTPRLRAFGVDHFAACHFPLQTPLPQ